MEETKREKLQAQGWAVGDATTFLGLNSEEAEYIEMKLALSLEADDASVSIDLLMKTLIAMGASRRELAETIGSVG